MAWADEIAEQNAILASNQKNLDWLQGNTATFHTGSSEEPIERTASEFTHFGFDIIKKNIVVNNDK